MCSINIHSQNQTVNELHYNNLIHFLSHYKTNPDISTTFSSSIQNEASIISKESLLPDMWTKTKCPINKNSAFVVNVLSKHKQDYKTLKKLPPNFFPQKPFNIPPSSELVKLSLNKVTLPEVISEDKLNEGNKDFSLKFKKKSWKVSLMHFNKVFYYGPMNSMKMYNFLTTVYNTMTQEEKATKSIMVIDLEFDIHYQPETLLCLFDNLYNDKKESTKCKDV